MNVFCGVDWAEDHHDVALVDGDGQLIAKRRITDDAAGFAELLGLFSDAGDTREQPTRWQSRPGGPGWPSGHGSCCWPAMVIRIPRSRLGSG